ncbi:MAG TPA: hypothetical protein VMV25_11050 [Steroidobacteraceae bacterium]|nr:hypothetical protein [Steroidobacteraceae bacterium]
MLRRTLYGRFRRDLLAAGAWRIASSAPGGPLLYLTGVQSDADAAPLPDAGAFADCTSIAVDWSDAPPVRVTLQCQDRSAALRACAAMLHEPLEGLYGALPLARLDERGLLFWRRVFRLVRLPGGRWLLGRLARRR